MAHAWAIPVGLVHDHLDRAVSGFRKNLQSVCVCVCVCHTSAGPEWFTTHMERQDI